MTDGQTLLLLTNRYPYGPGEEYLHTEIPYLAAQFEHVAILPLMRPVGSTHERELPNNTDVLDLQVNHGWSQRLRLLTRGLMQQVSAPDASKVRQRAYERYFHARTQMLADAAEPIIREYVKTHPVDVIYGYWFYVTTSVAVELRQRLSALAAVPVIARGHGYDVNEAASPAKYLPQRRKLLESVLRLHPTAQTITERMQHEWPQFADKISTRRLGVVAPGAPASRRNRGTINVLSCSSLSPIKRLELMAGGVAEALNRGLSVTWTHIGAGTEKQEAALERELARLGIRHVVNRPGQVDNHAVYEFLRSDHYTVFMNTSSSESVSFSMSEAMGAGLPVIGTDVVGTHEVLTDGANGRLLSPNPSPGDIADAIEWIASLSETEYTQLCEESLRRCIDLFDPQQVYTDFSRDLLAASVERHA